MSAGWICAARGNHYPGTEAPPVSCLICTDERQWVAPSGQRWTTMAELAAAGRHCDIWEEEPGLLGVGVNPPVGIGQRGPAKTRFGMLPRKPRAGDGLTRRRQGWSYLAPAATAL